MIHPRRLSLLVQSLSVLLVLLASASCHSPKDAQESPPLKPVGLVQEWIPNSNYAGAVLAKHRFASQNGIDLTIRPGSEQVHAVLEVAAGRADFGDASADTVLLANSKGSDLVVIGTVSQYSPTCFVVKHGSGIATPQDFVGRKIGVLTGTSTEKIYRILLSKFELPSPLPGEMEAPFDLTSFIQGQYDVRPAFIYDEPVTLMQAGVEFTMIDPIDYGVKFVGTVYFCRADTVAKNRDVVQAFVNSVCDGWKLATRRPEEAIRMLKSDWPEVDQERELESLKQGMRSFVRKDGRLLASVEADWKQMIADLSSLGDDTSDFTKIDLEKLLDNSFLDKYYARVEK